MSVRDGDTPDVRKGQAVTVHEFPHPRKYRVVAVSPTMITIDDTRRFRRYPTRTQDALTYVADDGVWITHIGDEEVIGRSPETSREENPGRPKNPLRAAREWAVRSFAERHNWRRHPSHLAARILEEAAEKFDIDHYGVEGFSDEFGNHGVSYLNMGDPYITTLLVRTSPSTARFSVGAWGDIVEKSPHRWQNPSSPPSSQGPTFRVELEVTEKDARLLASAQKEGHSVQIRVGS